MFYEPTFTISPEMHHMAFRIIEKLVRIERYGTLESNPRLKKQDVIRAIHSSCSIEGNSLTLGQVTDLINGHRVLGPERDVREVQNAYAAYTLLESFDPCDLNEMPKNLSKNPDGSAAGKKESSLEISAYTWHLRRKKYPE